MSLVQFYDSSHLRTNLCSPLALQYAFNVLGLTCYHSIQFFSNPQDCIAWNAAQDAKFLGKGQVFTRREWDALLGSFSAISADPPAIAFAEELVDLYPEAKVVLVEREIESWYNSFNAAVIIPTWSPFLNFLGNFDPWIIGPVRDCHYRWIRGWWKVNSKKDMQEKARDMYKEHYAQVRRIVPKERLLEYKLGDGWEPLCEFLGKPIPDIPFPRINDQDHMDEHLRIVAVRSMKNGLIYVGRYAAPVVALGLGWWIWRMS